VTQNQRLAAIINAVISALGIVLSLIPILRYGTDVPSSQPPIGILIGGIVFGLLGLLGSYGIFQGKRWGVVLTIVVRAIDGLLALPGIFVAEGWWLKFTAVLSVVAAVVVIWLLVRDRAGTRT
jgi:hypothetical protein